MKNVWWWDEDVMIKHQSIFYYPEFYEASVNEEKPFKFQLFPSVNFVYSHCHWTNPFGSDSLIIMLFIWELTVTRLNSDKFSPKNLHINLRVLPHEFFYFAKCLLLFTFLYVSQYVNREKEYFIHSREIHITGK